MMGVCACVWVNCVYRPRTPRRQRKVRDDETSVRFVDKTGDGKNVRCGNERPDIGSRENRREIIFVLGSRTGCGVVV